MTRVNNENTLSFAVKDDISHSVSPNSCSSSLHPLPLHYHNHPHRLSPTKATPSKHTHVVPHVKVVTGGEVGRSLEVEAVRLPECVAALQASPGDAVFLTWEDLWVTVSKGKSGYGAILEGITGYAQQGEVLAIMGPSGSGKSTLLDALADYYSVVCCPERSMFRCLFQSST